MSDSNSVETQLSIYVIRHEALGPARRRFGDACRSDPERPPSIQRPHRETRRFLFPILDRHARHTPQLASPYCILSRCPYNRVVRLRKMMISMILFVLYSTFGDLIEPRYPLTRHKRWSQVNHLNTWFPQLVSQAVQKGIHSSFGSGVGGNSRRRHQSQKRWCTVQNRLKFLSTRWFWRSCTNNIKLVGVDLDNKNGVNAWVRAT